MALVNPPNSGTSSQASAPAEASEFKAAKKAAAERHAKKIKEERQRDHERILAIRDELKTNGAYDKLSQESKDYIAGKCVPPSERVGHSGPSFFTQVFGDSAKVGDKVTLKDVITKTYKGMDTMSASVKKWAAKGTNVEIAVNKQDMLATTYTITSIGK